MQLKLLWADRRPRPHPQFQGFPALKFVQTPHLQSAEMLISCMQSRGVYKGTARADFSAELLLTQPAVKLAIKEFVLAVLSRSIFLIIYFFLPCVLPQSFSLCVPQSSAPARFPTSHLPHGLPPTAPRIPTNFSTVPRSLLPRSFPGYSHGPSFASTPLFPRSQSTTSPRNPKSLPPVFVR